MIKIKLLLVELSENVDLSHVLKGQKPSKLQKVYLKVSHMTAVNH